MPTVKDLKKKKKNTINDMRCAGWYSGDSLGGYTSYNSVLYTCSTKSFP